MAITFLDAEPTTTAAPPKGRKIVFLDDPQAAEGDPMDFSQFSQEATPEPIRPTPSAPVEEGVPATTSASFEPIEPQKRMVTGYTFVGNEKTKLALPTEMPEFNPDIERFLDAVKNAPPFSRQRDEIAARIAQLPKNDQKQIGDILMLRFGDTQGFTNIPHSDDVYAQKVDLTPGELEAFGRAAGGQAGPTAAGMTAAAAAMKVTPGPPIVKIPVSIGAGIGAAWLGKKGQDLAEKVGLGQERAAQLATQRNVDLSSQPWASFVGEVVPSFAFLRPSPSGLSAAKDLASRLIDAEGKEAVRTVWRAATPEARAYLSNSIFGSGINAGFQTLREASKEGDMDLGSLGRILAAAGIGATQTEPTKLGSKLGMPRTIDFLDKPVPKLTDVTAPKAPDATPTRFDEDPRATAALLDIDQRTSSIPLDEAGRRATGGEPTGIRLPDILTAEEAAAQGLPFQRGAVTRTPADEAALAAGRTAEDATIRADTENAIQDLVNEWSQLTGRPYEGLVNFRKGKTDLEFMQYLREQIGKAKAKPTTQATEQVTTQVAPASAPEAADEFGGAVPQWFKEKAGKESGDIPQGASEMLPAKAKLIRASIKEPGTTWVYSHNNLGEGIPAFTQVDAIKGGDNLVSTNPADLRAFGFDVPDLPPNTPQGKYSLEQAKALAAPKAPAPTESAAAPRALEAAAPEFEPGPNARAIMEGRLVGDETVRERAKFDLPDDPAPDAPLDPDAVGGANNPIVVPPGTPKIKGVAMVVDKSLPRATPERGTKADATAIKARLAAQPRPTTSPEPVSPVAETAPTPKAAPTSPTGRVSYDQWLKDVTVDNVDDLPRPYTKSMAELKAVDKKVAELKAKRGGSGLKDISGRINITPGTTTLGGALVGGAGGAGYGITQGDTVEERLENALNFGLAGTAIGAGAGRYGGKFAMTKAGHRVGKRLGVIEDFPVLNKDISNTRIQLQRIGGILMRGSRLRKPFFDAMRRTEADIGSMTDEAKIILSDARGKINANTTKGPQRDAVEAKLNEVFGDITKIGELPEYLRPVANRIHQIRLKGAARIAALSGIADATRDTVLENGGDYLARKYAIFNLRNGLEARAYKESLPKEDINAALDAIQESWKPKPKTKEQQKLAADMLEQVAQDRTNAVAVIKSLRQWMTDDDAARMAAWIAGGKQSGSDVSRRMRSLYNELINPTEVTRDEARVLLDEFLDRDTLAGFTLGRKQIGGKDVTSLYRKKEIDPRLRKVLGEVKDPLANAYQSIENQANLIGRDKQQREFIRIGEAMGIMTRDPDVALEKGMRPFVESGTKLNNPYDNYDGVFIYPWLRDEFKGSVIQADEIPKAGDVALKSLKSATALFKWLKLIPAPDSRSVNLIGAYWNNAINGRGINPVNGRTLDGVKSVFLANGLITPDGSPNAARLLALREILIRNRVLDESVLGRDFIENTRRSLAGQLFDKLDETAQREIDSPLARKAYMGGKFIASGREFAAGDDIFRVAGFLAEANRYKRAFPNLPEAEIEELAGRVLNQTGMTYSEVPYALRELSQLGVVEPFVSFPYSVFRSTANTARLGASEMADGLATGNTELAKIGATRLTALGIGATLASGYGLSRALNEKHDVTPEQEEAAKLFGPDYIKDSPLAFDSKIENGKATFVQMNYLLPTSLVTEAIEEGLKKAAEDGPMAGVGAGVRSTASQFTGMLDDSRQQVPPVPRTIGLALGLLNEDSFGRPIYNPEDPDKWKKIAGTIGYDWSPGFWSKAVRLYKANNPAAQDPNSPRVYSNSEEFMRFLGRRATTVDAKTVFPSKAYQLNQDYQNATRLYQEAVRKTGTEGPEAVAAYASAQSVITEKFNEMVEMRDAARLLGMSDDTITAGFLRGGLSKRLTGQVMQSINIPPPKEALDARIEKRDAQRKAYREIGGDVSGDARGLVARVRAQNLPPDQFLKALEAEWRASGVGTDASGRMTREFADALKAEIERTR